MDRQGNASSTFWWVVDRLSRVPLGTVLVVAVAVRLAAGLAFPAGSTEGYEYAAIARHIVDGDGYSYFPAADDRMLPLSETDDASRWVPSSYVPPLYTYVTVVATELGGGTHTGTVWALRGFNLLMAAGAILAVHALARRLIGSERGATLAALGYAVYPPFVYMATQVSGANLYIPVEMMVLLALLAGARSRSVWLWIGAGLGLGAVALLRGEGLLLIPLAAGWLLWAARISSFDRRRLAALFLAAACLLPAGWMVRNRLAFGRPLYAVATSGGYNLWAGNHDGASGSQKNATYPAELRQRLLDLPAEDDFELNRDYVLRRAALEDMRDDPGGTLLRYVKKAALLVGADVHDRRSLNPAYLGGWLLLLVFGTRGLLAWWRAASTDRTERVLIAGFLAFNAAISVLFVVLPRYRLPIEAVLLVFAGAWLASRSSEAQQPEAPAAVTAG